MLRELSFQRHAKCLAWNSPNTSWRHRAALNRRQKEGAGEREGRWRGRAWALDSGRPLSLISCVILGESLNFLNHFCPVGIMGALPPNPHPVWLDPCHSMTCPPPVAPDESWESSLKSPSLLHFPPSVYWHLLIDSISKHLSKQLALEHVGLAIWGSFPYWICKFNVQPGQMEAVLLFLWLADGKLGYTETPDMPWKMIVMEWIYYMWTFSFLPPRRILLSPQIPKWGDY